jgi:subtilisin family serine protease
MTKISNFYINSSSQVKVLEYLNMIIIKQKENLLISNVHLAEECVNTIEKDIEITLYLPKNMNDDEDQYKQWQLKRTNVVDLPLPDSFERRINCNSCEKKTHVLVLDTGIDANHKELKDKIAPDSQHISTIGTDLCCRKEEKNFFCDCQGHGTHVAGIVSSMTAGYNPNTILHSIKIFDKCGSGTLSSILEGFDASIDIKQKYFPNETTISNMSFGISVRFPLIDNGVTAMVNAGIFVVVAAGNSNKNACNQSPAGEPNAFTVASSNISDNRSSFSNYGDCVDMFAPGENIYSTFPNDSYALLSGTSMASPYVAGFASAIACAEGLTIPEDIRKAVLEHSTSGKIIDAKSYKDYLPYDGEKKMSFLNN